MKYRVIHDIKSSEEQYMWDIEAANASEAIMKYLTSGCSGVLDNETVEAFQI